MSAHILIIEDNHANMDLVVFLLNAFGHTALPAFNGEEGIELARHHMPDLIISDIDLPKLDGYGVLRVLKSETALRRIPVIALTALAMVGDREKLLAAGFDGYLSKPIEPTTFVAQIEKFLPADLHSSFKPDESAAVTVSGGARRRRGDFA